MFIMLSIMCCYRLTYPDMLGLTQCPQGKYYSLIISLLIYITRLHPTSLQEDSTDRLVPHTPVYTSGDQSLATHVLAPSVPVSDQPRMVTSQSANSAAQGQWLDNILQCENQKNVL